MNNSPFFAEINFGPFIIVCAQLQLLHWFSLYETLTSICILLYMPVQVILKTGTSPGFSVPHILLFSATCTWSGDLWFHHFVDKGLLIICSVSILFFTGISSLLTRSLKTSASDSLLLTYDTKGWCPGLNRWQFKPFRSNTQSSTVMLCCDNTLYV